MNTQQERDNLLPCPFCGSDEISIKTDLSISYVDCSACDTQGPVVEGSPAAAIARWNRRAALQSQDREDAERYRRLREGQIDDIAVVRGLGATDYGASVVIGTYEEEIDGDDLDEAIDYARRIEGEGE